MWSRRIGMPVNDQDLAGPQRGMTWQVRFSILLVQQVMAYLPGLLPEKRTCQVLQLILYLIFIYNEPI